MLATYKGKLIYNGPSSTKLVYVLQQDQVDELISRDARWPDSGASLTSSATFRKDDGSELTDSDFISLSEVPNGVDYSITVDIAFVEV